MKRDGGQYFLPHIFWWDFDEKHPIGRSAGNTQNISRRQSSVSSQRWLRQQLIAAAYIVSAYFGSDLENYLLWYYLTNPDESIQCLLKVEFTK